ncbi:MAG: tripartite tricarboxylate transporter substrate binding protein [Betaproteobacteria bacterium]|nr:MAG: tripartite tricarboxylate transporter substrate binding protein [Betaproteobacteria bacterium]
MRQLIWLVFLLFVASSEAQDYPSRPIRILVPFAPGGAVDTSTRILTQKMNERLGWNFVVENRPGGNGFIATTAVQKSAPDGYTLLMAHTGEFAVNPALFDNVPYELERDFVPITMVSDAPMLYLANSAAPFNNFQELVTVAKAKPGAITFSSAGSGSINHLAGEWLAQAAGIQLVHVPYKGGAPAAAAVAAGDVHFGVMAAPGAIPHIKSGRGKVIGITTAKKSPLDPSWATPRDAGIRRHPGSRRLDLGGAIRAEGHAAGDYRPHQRGSASDTQLAGGAEALRRERRRRGSLDDAGRVPGAHQGRRGAL